MESNRFCFPFLSLRVRYTKLNKKRSFEKYINGLSKNLFFLKKSRWLSVIHTIKNKQYFYLMMYFLFIEILRFLIKYDR